MLVSALTHWPTRPDIDREESLPDIKPAMLIAHPLPEEFGNQCSSLSRLCRVKAWILRFVRKAKDKKQEFSPYLSIQELCTAKTTVIRASQRHTYSAESCVLQKGQTLQTSNTLYSLAPYMDSDGLMRIGGRLQKAELTVDATHPILLSVQSYIARLLVEKTHRLALDAASATVMAIMFSRQCVPCQKAYARTSKQRMGELPAARVKPAWPFSITGIDFAGPFTYKEGNQWKPTLMKGYLCVYVSFATMAVFIDLVADMSTDAFMASLRRFSAIYCSPSEIHSDNGSSFVGANSELKRLSQLLQSNKTQEVLHNWSSNKGISWYFSPCRAPHFGSLWESAVKAIKMILKKVVGK